MYVNALKTICMQTQTMYTILMRTRMCLLACSKLAKIGLFSRSIDSQILYFSVWNMHYNSVVSILVCIGYRVGQSIPC